MPFARFRLPRRRPSLRLQSPDHEWFMFHPDPDQPLVVAGFGEAASLAAIVMDLPVRNEMLVLLDERRVVTAMLLDPPAELGLFVGMAQVPGLETPFCQTLDIVIRDRVETGPPSADDRRGYHALRRAHMAQGLLLLDVVVTDGDMMRSLAIGCDPDPVWFDEWDPDTLDAA